MESPLIAVSFEDDLAKLTLNLPKKHNDSCLDLYENLLENLSFAQKSKKINFVLLKGIDDPLNQWGILRPSKRVKGSGSYGVDGHIGENVYDVFQNVLNAIDALDKIVISVVDGNVLEQGLSISMVSDFVMSTSRSSWGAPNLGKHMLPSWSCAWRLKELIGKMRAKKICFTETIESAEAAVRWGLWTDVVPYKNLDKSVDTLLDQLRSNNQNFNRQLKYVFNHCKEFDLDAAKSFELLSARLNGLRTLKTFSYDGVDENRKGDEVTTRLKQREVAKKFWGMVWDADDLK